MIDLFTIALLTAEFGQVWAKLGLQKSRTTLREIARLHNFAVTVCLKADFLSWQKLLATIFFQKKSVK